jgi:hypothetical protein
MRASARAAQGTSSVEPPHPGRRGKPTTEPGITLLRRHHGWKIEEGYKREKCRVEIENFSGRSAQVIKQDFYAKIFALNLTAILSWVAQAIADRLYKERKRPYRVNFANALSKMKDNLVRLLLCDSPAHLLTPLVFAMARSVEAVRPERSYPRKIKPAKLHGFHPNYKRCR